MPQIRTVCGIGLCRAGSLSWCRHVGIRAPEGAWMRDGTRWLNPSAVAGRGAATEFLIHRAYRSDPRSGPRRVAPPLLRSAPRVVLSGPDGGGRHGSGPAPGAGLHACRVEERKCVFPPCSHRCGNPRGIRPSAGPEPRGEWVPGAGLEPARPRGAARFKLAVSAFHHPGWRAAPRRDLTLSGGVPHQRSGSAMLSYFIDRLMVRQTMLRGHDHGPDPIMVPLPGERD